MKTKPLLVKIAAISSQSNSFGLSGHVLVARDGRAWEAARCRYTPGQDAPKGAELTLHEAAEGETLRECAWFNSTQPHDVCRVTNWAALGFEIPRALPKCPANVLAQIWPLTDAEVRAGTPVKPLF